MNIAKTIVILLFVLTLTGRTNNNQNGSRIDHKKNLCCNKNTNFLDTITIKKVDIVSLNKIIVINPQMDSIINNTVKYLQKKVQMFFYITLMKQNDNIYIEIMGVLNNNGIFEFNDKGASDDNYLRTGTKVYGCLEKQDKNFYVLSYPPPYDVNIDDFKKIFQITRDKINIKKESCNEIFIYENPIWLYQYSKDEIKLLNSVNNGNVSNRELSK